MEIIISGRHLGVTDEMKAHADKRLQVLATEYPKLTSARVVMEMERNWHKVELHVVGKHLNLEATAKTTDMYASVDEAVTKVEKQLRKFLDRVHEHHRAHNGKTETPAEAEEEAEAAVEAEEVEEEENA